MGQPTGEGERGKVSQSRGKEAPGRPPHCIMRVWVCVWGGGAWECQGPATPLRPPSKSVFH